MRVKRVVTAYEVRDNPSSMNPDDWDRVVAEKEWQFKDWHHIEMFNKILGFYIHYEDGPESKTVKQWNVKIIFISKNTQHLDRVAALEVWDRLEEFNRSRSQCVYG